MEISKNFDFISAEQKWYGHWLDKKYFESKKVFLYFRFIISLV